MEELWMNLPSDISYRICNKLPEVRAIPYELSLSINQQFWMLERLVKLYRNWFGHDGYYFLVDDLNAVNQSDMIDPWDIWYDMNKESRTEFYNNVFGK
jgi:hypothetical protein